MILLGWRGFKTDPSLRILPKGKLTETLAFPNLEGCPRACLKPVLRCQLKQHKRTTANGKRIWPCPRPVCWRQRPFYASEFTLARLQIASHRGGSI